MRNLAEKPAQDAKSAEDRAELVRPAPAGFVGGSPAAAVRLIASVHDNSLRLGESLWYRLEMQNIGKSDIDWRETSSFFKHSNHLQSSSVFLTVTMPDGRKVSPSPTPYHIGHCPGGHTGLKSLDARGVQEEDFKDLLAQASTSEAKSRALAITLHPGETLITRPSYTPDPCGARKPRQDFKRIMDLGFRELPWPQELTAVGTYHFTFFVDFGQAAPPTESELREFEERTGVSRERQLRLYEFRRTNRLQHTEANDLEIIVIK